MKILLLLAVLSCIIGTAECVDGKWGKWSKWSLCSLKCGGGIKERTRVCNNPAPSDGGRACGGGATGTVKCNTAPCRTVVDGGFSEWFDWGKCSKKCGSGTMTRWRACNNPKPMRGGKQCEGANTASQACNTQGCPVNGRYAEWSRWGDCSTTCGGGELTRTRTCTNPAPANGGKDCVGVASLSRACNKHACQAGGLSDWSAWGQCNAECGGGTQSRTRACDSPAPAPGGADCSGDLEGEQNCNEDACPYPIKADVNVAQLPLAPQVWPGPGHRISLKLDYFGSYDHSFEIAVIFNSPTMGTVKLYQKTFMPNTNNDNTYIGYEAYDLAGKTRPGMYCVDVIRLKPTLEVVASPHSKDLPVFTIDGDDTPVDRCAGNWVDFFVDTFMPTVSTWTIDNKAVSYLLSSEELAKVLDISYMIDGEAEE